MSDLWQDLRYGLRSVAKDPGFAAVAVLTLALGIGANTALFSLLDAVLLKALPYKEPHRLVVVGGQERERPGTYNVPIPLMEVLRERARTMEAISIYRGAGGALRTPHGPVEVRGLHVSSNFVELMGVAPLEGRGFFPGEENPDSPPVMIVSFSFWQRHMGGDPEAVGRTVYLDGPSLEGLPCTVVGIMPPEFRGLWDYWGTRTEFWTPYASEQIRASRRERGDSLLARLAPAATPEESRRELDAIAATVEVDGWGEGGRRFALIPLKDFIVRDSASIVQLLLAAVAVVLAIACANLAQLLLARSDRRIAEFATRKAIGASASQLFRLALAESLVLSAAGGAGGVLLAYWLLPVMLALAPSEIPRISEAAIDGRVLMVAVGLTVLVGCAFGLAPALRLSRLSVTQAMKRGPESISSARAPFRSWLVMGQVACSVALFVMTGLIGQTFLTLLPSNPGFEAESRTVFQLTMPPYMDTGERLRRWDDLVRRVEAIPGVAGVGLGSNVPFAPIPGGGDTNFYSVSSIAETAGTKDDPKVARVNLRAISPNFFQLLEMPLLRGRIFTSADRAESPGVAIVNEVLARKLAPGGRVLGQKVRIEGLAAQAPLPAYEIVGIAAGVRSTGTSAEAWDEIYIPQAQSRARHGFLIVRSGSDSIGLHAMLLKEIRSWVREWPEGPWQQAMAMGDTAMALEDLVSRSLAGPRFSATLISAFSGMALLLTAIGVFGLVAYSVSQRFKEFGIRAALGARPRDLLSTTMRSAVVLTAVGIVLGLVASVYLTRFVESQLYGIERLDLPTFLGAAAVMLAVAGLAAYLPARRAARVDPMTALRHE